MSDIDDLIPGLGHEEPFEVQLRGYSRRQVDEFLAQCRGQSRDQEERLASALSEAEQLRQEVTALRQQVLADKPPHEEVSERMAQILKLADDEAEAHKSRAREEIARMRTQAQQESDQVRTEAKEQSRRMLTAAQEKAENAISAARSEAERTSTEAHAEAERTVTDARKEAEDVISTARAQAKKALDEATARATAVRDGAERRLSQLSAQHADTIRQLNGILNGVSALVTSETSRASLAEEVEEAVAHAVAETAPADPAPPEAPGNGHDAGDAAPGRDIDGGTAAETAPGGTLTPGSLGARREAVHRNAVRHDPVRRDTTGQDSPGPAPAVRPAGASGQRGVAAQPNQAYGSHPAGGAYRAQGDSTPASVARAAAGSPGGQGREPLAVPRPPWARPGGRPDGQRQQATGNGREADADRDRGLTGAIDADEPAEGVRIISERRASS